MSENNVTSLSVTTKLQNRHHRKACPVRSIQPDNHAASTSSFECSQCQQTFEYKYLLIIHEMSHRKQVSDDIVAEDNIEQPSSLKKFFFCDFCNKKFKSKLIMGMHMRHCKMRLFKCSLCDETYARKADLETHLKEIHENNQMKCSHCNYFAYDVKEMTQHQTSHTDAKNQCKIREKAFYRQSHPRLHTENAHKKMEDEEDSHEGKIDDKLKNESVDLTEEEGIKIAPSTVKITAKLTSPTNLIPDITTEKLFEIKLTHSKPNSSENDPKSNDINAKMVKIVSIRNKQRKEKENENMQTIYKNGKTMIDPMELFRKQLNVETVLVKPNPLNVPVELMEDPLSIVKQELQDFGEYQITSYTTEPPARPAMSKLTCIVCNFSCESFASLILHQRKHNRRKNEGIYICDLCPLKFNEKVLLEIHMNVTHRQEKRLQCSDCSFSTNIIMKMRNHKRNAHFKPFECDMCKNIFHSRKALLDHQKIMHIKDSQCKVCGKYFKNMTYVNRHIKTTHANNKFKCSYCNQYFATRGEINQHVGSLWKIGQCSSHVQDEIVKNVKKSRKNKSQ